MIINKYYHLFIPLLAITITTPPSSANRLDVLKRTFSNEVAQFKKCLNDDKDCDQVRKKIYIATAILIPAITTGATLFGLVRFSQFLIKDDKSLKQADDILTQLTQLKKEQTATITALQEASKTAEQMAKESAAINKECEKQEQRNAYQQRLEMLIHEYDSKKNEIEDSLKNTYAQSKQPLKKQLDNAQQWANKVPRNAMFMDEDGWEEAITNMQGAIKELELPSQREPSQEGGTQLGTGATPTLWAEAIKKKRERGG